MLVVVGGDGLFVIVYCLVECGLWVVGLFKIIDNDLD